MYGLFKWLWVLAVVPKTVQLLLLCFLMLWVYRTENLTVRLNGALKKDLYYVLLVLCNGIYFFSILVSLFTEQHELSRIFAAVNTFAATTISLVFYHYYSRTKLDMEKVEYYMFWNMNILFLLYLLYCVLGEKGNLPFLGILGRWDVSSTRFVGYLEYANLTVFMYLYCYAFAVNYLSKRIHPLLVFGCEVLYLLPLFAANSRTGVVCGVVLTGISFALTKWNVIMELYKKHKPVIWAGGAVVLVFGCLLMGDAIASILEKFMSYRSGSNASRMLIYTSSIEKMLTESPVWGCGIKDRIFQGGYPYGSHSTYIGMFYKTGLVGGAIYLSATAVTVWGIIRRKERSRFDIMISFAFLALFALAVLEDLDGANWNIVVFMSLFALCFRNSDCRL